jgi:hypothetical protein
MLKSSTNVRFLAVVDSGLEIESTAPSGRPAGLSEISIEWRMGDLCFIGYLLERAHRTSVALRLNECGLAGAEQPRISKRSACVERAWIDQAAVPTGLVRRTSCGPRRW